MNNNTTQTVVSDRYRESDYLCREGFGGLARKVFSSNSSVSEASTVVLYLLFFRTLNSFFYAFSLSGVAIERYLLVCKSTVDTFLKNFNLKLAFYVSFSIGPFILWLLFLGLFYWSQNSLVTGYQYSNLVRNILLLY